MQKKKHVARNERVYALLIAASSILGVFHSMRDCWILFNYYYYEFYIIGENLMWMLRRAAGHRLVPPLFSQINRVQWKMVNWSDFRSVCIIAIMKDRKLYTLPKTLECNDMKFTCPQNKSNRHKHNRLPLNHLRKFFFLLFFEFHKFTTYHKTVNLFPILWLDRIWSSMVRIVRSQNHIRRLPPICHLNRISFWLGHLAALLAVHKLQKRKKVKERIYGWVNTTKNTHKTDWIDLLWSNLHIQHSIRWRRFTFTIFHANDGIARIDE